MKILVISYWFPPAGVIGAKRWGEFYNLSLKDNNLDITVLTGNWIGDKVNGNIHYLGVEIKQKPFFSLNKEINYLDVFRHPTLMIRALDSSIMSDWYKYVKSWIDINSKNEFDLVISSFGPISSVLLGRHVQQKYSIPHIVDLRDLISIQGQKMKVPFIHFLDKQIDKFIMRKVDSFFVVSSTGNKKAKRFYKKEVNTIYNGLANPITEKEVDLSIKNKNKINILYMGTLGVHRNPKKILMLLNSYAKEYLHCRISVRFASQDNPLNFIQEESLEHIQISWLGYLLPEALDIEKEKSNIFLLLEDLTVNGNENLTGKIFEYLNSKKPIIVSCHEDSDIVKLLQETNAGSLINTVEAFREFLDEKRYLNIEQCNFYTREKQYKIFKDIIGKYYV